MDRSCKGRRGEGCKGQGRLCLDRLVKSEQVHSSATASRRWRFLGRAGAERRGLSRGLPGSHFTAASRCWNRANLQSRKEKNYLQSTQVTELLPPPSAHPPCFPNMSVLCFAGKVIEDCVETEDFPQNKWSVLIWIHLSIWEVQMIWQNV